MLTLLTKILGPYRAITVYGFLQSWGMGVLFAVTLLAIGAVLFLGSSDGPKHVAYIEAEILGTQPLSGDQQSGIFVTLKMPDGEVLRLTETEGLIAGNLDQTACVEHRETQNGAPVYRLRRLHRCSE